MFYEIRETGLEKIKPEDINSGTLTAGYVTDDELQKIYGSFGFSVSTVQSCRQANEFFRSGVEIYDDYTFTELRIFGGDAKDDDCIALYLKKNLIIVVDVKDNDGSTRDKFVSALKRYPAGSATLEKVIYAFFDSLVNGDIKKIEEISVRLSALEEELINDKIDKDFNITLLTLKKDMLRMMNYYEQILDITDAVEENENDLFESESLMYINNIGKRVERMKEDVNSLKSSIEHLQDSYSAYLDVRLNNTMKLFTVLTSIFFPLTIIVGWYGMNFDSMPEFHWRYGYIYVIALSVGMIAAFAVFGKKKKWF